MAHVIIIGAGINGVTAAIELKKRNHKVTIVDPGPLPHPLAASTDISKAVRAAYGADEDYTALAERSIRLWHEWNKELGVDLYHQTGALFLRQQAMQPGDFEYESCKLLEKHGHKLERIDSAKLRERFPAFNAEFFHDGFFDPEAGYVESGLAVVTLAERARSLGVELREHFKFIALDEDARHPTVILSPSTSLRAGSVEESRSGNSLAPSRDLSTALGMTRIDGDVVVAAMGAWTPYVLPFTRKFFRATGHPVFHLKPSEATLFLPERFPFFGADISTTGYYGFPLNQGVVKIANHGLGREMSPDSPQRSVRPEEEKGLRDFLRSTIPALVDAPVVYTRICLYCDTHDGNFWIAPDPERPGLIIATGDSGHGFKFAPVLGEIIADAVEGKPNALLGKFRWRPEVRSGEQKEAARCDKG